MGRLPVAILVLGLLNGVAFAVSPDPKALQVSPADLARARDLVRQLGSDDFPARDRAQRELRRMGRLALPVLQDAMVQGSNDPEIRFSCERILPWAEADDMAARVAAFLADVGGKFEHDLPGWAPLRTVAGDESATRELFAAIVKDKDRHDLLLAVEKGGLELARVLTVRRTTLAMRANPQFPVPAGRQVNPDLADVALLLLAESCVAEKDAPFVGNQYHLSNFFYQPQGRDAVSGGGQFGSVFRKLALHWLDTRNGPNGVMTAMNLAQNLNLGAAEVTKYAARMLTVEGGHAWNRANAACLIARYEAKDHLPAITKLFDDETFLIRGNNRQPDIQVRDVGLAMALLLSGQDPKDYGFELANASPQVKYNYTTFRFRDEDKLTADAKRTAAFKKWKEWEAARPK